MSATAKAGNQPGVHRRQSDDELVGKCRRGGVEHERHEQRPWQGGGQSAGNGQAARDEHVAPGPERQGAPQPRVGRRVRGRAGGGRGRRRAARARPARAPPARRQSSCRAARNAPATTRRPGSGAWPLASRPRPNIDERPGVADERRAEGRHRQQQPCAERAAPDACRQQPRLPAAVVAGANGLGRGQAGRPRAIGREHPAAEHAVEEERVEEHRRRDARRAAAAPGRGVRAGRARRSAAAANSRRRRWPPTWRSAPGSVRAPTGTRAGRQRAAARAASPAGRR